MHLRNTKAKDHSLRVIRSNKSKTEGCYSYIWKTDFLLVVCIETTVNHPHIQYICEFELSVIPRMLFGRISAGSKKKKGHENCCRINVAENRIYLVEETKSCPSIIQIFLCIRFCVYRWGFHFFISLTVFHFSVANH